MPCLWTSRHRRSVVSVRAVDDRWTTDRRTVVRTAVATVLTTATAAGVLGSSSHPNGWKDRAGAATTSASSQLLPLSSFSNDPSKLSMTTAVAEAVDWIDAHGDRRFLHAMVASDYRFLYRGVTVMADETGSSSSKSNNDNNKNTMTRPTLRRTGVEEPLDLLQAGTYRHSTDDTIDDAALAWFQAADRVLAKDTVRPSNGHVATTSFQEAARWGTPMSVWPRHGAHFAWLKEEGDGKYGNVLYPRTDRKGMAREDWIVDGRDCGTDALEDALRGEGWDVLVATEAFLAVPVTMENALRERLRGSFLL